MSIRTHQVKGAFYLVIVLYGFWYGFLELWFSFLPLGVIPALTLLLLINYFSLPKPSSAQVEQIAGKELGEENGENDVLMTAIAHRGAALDAPENSMEAFKLCSSKKCRVVEFDVALTKDDVPIIFHDDTLERMANLNWHVKDRTWKDLKGVDISVNHPYADRYKDSTIPTLEDTVEHLLSTKQHMFIDLKNYSAKMVNVILNLYDKYPELYNCAVVSSFYPWLIYMIRRKNPKIVGSLAYRPYYFSHEWYTMNGIGPRRADAFYKHIFLYTLDSVLTWALPRFTTKILGASFLVLHRTCLSGQAIQEWRNKGVRLIVYTVNLPTEKQYLNKVLKVPYFTDTLVGENFHAIADKS